MLILFYHLHNEGLACFVMFYARKSPFLFLFVTLTLSLLMGFKQVEDILFAAGEALSFLWGGVPVTAAVILKTNYSSLSMNSNYLMGDISSTVPVSSSLEYKSDEDCQASVREAITRKLFDALLYSNKKEERCAGTVWLLSLTMYCGRHPTIQHILPEIQVSVIAFKKKFWFCFFLFIYIYSGPRSQKHSLDSWMHIVMQ